MSTKQIAFMAGITLASIYLVNNAAARPGIVKTIFG